jgi:hypothetical protein
MKIILCALVITAFVGMCFGESAPPQPDIDLLDKCPNYLFEPFKITPYLEVAVLLQEMPIEQRVQLLRKWASNPKDRNEQKLLVLCQMLFVKKDGSSIIGSSGLGYSHALNRFPDQPKFYGPIVVYEDCPISICLGYRLAGMAVPSSHYIEIGIKEELWRKTRYKVLSVEEQRRIIDDFVKSGEWADLVAFIGNPTFFTKQAEQDGTEQPATRSESKLEGSNKPQPESEGRSR